MILAIVYGMTGISILKLKMKLLPGVLIRNWRSNKNMIEAIKIIFSDIVEFIKIQIKREKALKKIEKCFNESMLYDRKTGRWQRKEIK